MWRILEIGEKIEVGDERYWPKNMAWSTVTESCIGSQVVRTDHVVRREISDNAESAKPTHNRRITKCPKCGSSRTCYWMAHDRSGCYDCDWIEGTSQCVNRCAKCPFTFEL